MDKKNISFADKLSEYKDRGDLIPILQAAQNENSYISQKIMNEISEKTGISLADIYGVVTFYKQFRQTMPGKYTIKVCDGTACHVNESTLILEKIKELLNINIGETTSDGFFTLETVACLGCCSLAPAMMIQEKVHGKLTPKLIKEILAEYKRNSSVMNILREDR